MARFCPLFSGSKGNSIYIGSSGGGILIDAGVSAKRIEKALSDRSIDIRSIEAICVTHEHSDHIAGVRVLAKRHGIKIISSIGTLDALMDSCVISEKNDYFAINGNCIEVAGMSVSAFHTSHDSRESIGFRIETEEGRSFAVATDTGVIDEDIRKAITGCDLVLIESNHDVRMLENGSYPYFLKRRILGKSGHLSNESCSCELPKLIENGTTRIILGHLSQENNFPDLAHSTAKATLDKAGFEENKDYILEVAAQESCLPVMIL